MKIRVAVEILGEQRATLKPSMDDEQLNAEWIHKPIYFLGRITPAA